MVASQNPAVGWKLSAAGSTWMQIENHPLLAISVYLFSDTFCCVHIRPNKPISAGENTAGF